MRHRPLHSLAEKRDFARVMRENPTKAEGLLWECLRAKQLGVLFRRQITVAGFIVDFWCPALRLAIEVDGSIHHAERVAGRDAEKAAAFERKGIHLVRFANDELFTSLPDVVDDIRRECAVAAGLKGFSFPLKHSAVVADACASLETSPISRAALQLPTFAACKTGRESVDAGANQELNPDELADFDRRLADLARSKRMPEISISPGRRKQMQSQKISLYRREA